MPQVRNKKTGEVKEVGEVVAKDAKLLANMGFALVNPNEFPQEPKPEKKSVKDAVDDGEIKDYPFEEPKQKRKYTRKQTNQI